MNTLSIFDICTLVHRNNISKPHPQVASYNLVHPYLWLITTIISKGNADSIFPFLTLNTKSNKEIYINQNNNPFLQTCMHEFEKAIIISKHINAKTLHNEPLINSQFPFLKIQPIISINLIISLKTIV